MEDHRFAKFLKRKVESAEGKTNKTATKTLNDDKKVKGISASWSVQSKSKSTRQSCHGFKTERSAPGGSTKTRSRKQIDVKHGTLTTNLASTYFSKVAKTPIPYCMSQNQPPKTPPTQKHKLKERAHKSRGYDSRGLAQADDKVCYILKDVTKTNRKRKEDDSAYDDSNITYDTTDDTDVDMPSLQNEMPYSMVQHERRNSQPKSTLKKESRDNSKDEIENKPIPVGGLLDIPDDPFKTFLKNQECSTDTQKLLECGTNPSITLIASLYETNKLKIQKSSIPIKCVKSVNRPITDALQKISFILEEVKELEDEITMFDGSSTDHRDYVYMDEVMMRNLIKLDNLETNNNEIVRTKRKTAIQFIQTSMNRLQRKLIENQTNIDLDEFSVSTESTFDHAISKRKIPSI